MEKKIINGQLKNFTKNAYDYAGKIAWPTFAKKLHQFSINEEPMKKRMKANNR